MIKYPLSQAEKLAFVSFCIALPLLFLWPYFALIPLLLFLFCCLIAPFCPRWGFFLPIISRANTGTKAVALTFDDGPSPDSTPFILQLLKEHNFTATFFVIGKRAERYPELIEEILAADHTIGNHSWKHDNLLMLRSKKTLADDIGRSQQLLRRHGIRPLVFRPPAGISNPRLKTVLEENELKMLTFSCRAFDGGNKKIENLAGRILDRLQPGDIVLLHDIFPEKVEAVRTLQNELTILFAGLVEGAYVVQPLESLIGVPAMKKTNTILLTS